MRIDAKVSNAGPSGSVVVVAHLDYWGDSFYKTEQVVLDSGRSKDLTFTFARLEGRVETELFGRPLFYGLPSYDYEVRTYPGFVVPGDPRAMVFDGENLWIASYSQAALTKVPSRGTGQVRTTAVGRYPAALTYDGKNVWVAVEGAVRALDLNNMEVVSNVPFELPSYRPRILVGLAFSGQYLWGITPSYPRISIIKIDPAQRKVVQTAELRDLDGDVFLPRLLATESGV